MSEKRKSNWNLDELDALVKGVDVRRDVLLGSFKGNNNQSIRNAAWDCVADSVNAVSQATSVRTGKDCRKKWQCFMSETKKKEVTRRRLSSGTGVGRPPSPLTSSEEAALAAIPKSLIEGIPGGVDSQIGINADCSDTYFFDNAVVDFSEASQVVPEPIRNSYHQNLHDSQEQPKTKKRRQDKLDSDKEKLIGLEEERLILERRRLVIEERRLEIEERRLVLAEQSLSVQQTQQKTLETIVDLINTKRSFMNEIFI